jgi:hypothetical protein
MAVLAFGSCDLYPSSLLDPLPVDAGRPPNGTGIGPWSRRDANGCFSAGLPNLGDRPKRAGDSTASEPIYVAFDRVWLGAQTLAGENDENAWQEFGFDLDGRCTLSATCSPESSDGAAPVPPAAGCQPSTQSVPFDGSYCRDNTLGRFVNTVTATPIGGDRFRLSNEGTNCGLCLGYFSYILRISGYNGGANDDRVRLDLYPSGGLSTPYPFGCDDGAWRTFPCWQSADRWQVDQAFLAGAPPAVGSLPDSTLADPEAFVRDGYLVARWPAGGVFWLPHRPGVALSSYPTQLVRGFVTGRLARGLDGTWVLDDGMIAGVLSRDGLLRGFRQLGLCAPDPLYDVLQSFLGGNLDLRADEALDPALPCDAISLAIGFRARQATIGTALAITPLQECVPPESTTLPPGVPANTR